MKTYLFITIVFLLLLIGCQTVFAQADCYASGDVNGDGIILSITDLVYLTRYLSGDGPAPVDLFEADLNGDCHIDYLDLLKYQCLFDSGMICFDEFPVPTCCEPDTITGSCCIFNPDTCVFLAQENCEAVQGNYSGSSDECDFQQCCCNLAGDGNNDGQVNILDVVFTIEFMYLEGDPPSCWAEAQVRGGNTINILEVTYLISFLYQHGPAPVCGTGN